MKQLTDTSPGKRILKWIWLLSAFLLLSGCIGDSSPSSAQEKCELDGGYVEHTTYPDGSTQAYCVTNVEYTFDDGTQVMTHSCLLSEYETDSCDSDAALDKMSSPYSSTADSEAVNTYLHSKVLDIMRKIENTGYAHNKDNNFSLIPSYNDLTTPQTTYNLFLDCSGFVGYYLLQGLVNDLYSAAQPSEYACQDRPLAADFARIIEAAPQVDGHNHISAQKSDIAINNVCWGQVEHIKHIQPGDVIVYRHPEHIGEKDRDCGSRKVHRVDGNTGHILFAMDTAFESNRCKENMFSCGIKQELILVGDWQWVVKVADSTTSRHMDDSRHVGKDNSNFEGHPYHAWSQECEDCVIKRCSNGEYHRSCFANGDTAVEVIRINTSHQTHPTGIGVGKMYFGPDLKSYRTNYTADIKRYKNHNGDYEQIVFIGRPIKCNHDL